MVYNQHRRYFHSNGDNRCPRTIFVDHLALQIKQWKAAGENVLLFIDANSDAYDGILAKALTADDIYMREVCRDILGHKSPITVITQATFRSPASSLPLALLVAMSSNLATTMALETTASLHSMLTLPH